MELLIAMIRLALCGFLLWGVWLCFRQWMAERKEDKTAQLPVEPGPFERAASLVLLALLWTTIALLA